MSKDLPWRDAIEHVLKSAGTAMHYTDIAEEIIKSGTRKKVGATPATTVSAYITNSVRTEGDASPFLKVSRGEWALRSDASSGTIVTPADKFEDETTENQYRIITSFGMFWRRELVNWTPTPKVLGMQQIGAEAVDFSKQIGIYLLYDGRDIVYVGRSTERPLGRRLYEHTLDRLSARWNRFSWFGLLPVSESGELEILPDNYNATLIIPVLEAVLVEALEPPQNRKRGDDLAAVEFLQREDPEINKKRIRETLENALTKV